MIKYIKNKLWAHLLAQYNCKFSLGVCSLGKLEQLEFEEHVRVGQVLIDGGESFNWCILLHQKRFRVARRL